MTEEISLIHNSGFHDQPPVSLARAAKKFQLKANMIGYTEMGSDKRLSAIRGLNPRWQTVAINRGGADETAQQFKRSVWKVNSFEALRLSDRENPGHRTAPQTALVSDIQSRKTNVRGLYITNHFISHVEAPDGFDPKEDVRVAIYKDSISTISRFVAHAKQTGKFKFIIVSADFNLDMHKRWVRTYIHGHFPSGFWIAEFNHLPNKGSLQGRLIDWFVVWGITVKETDVLKDVAKQDHDPVFLKGVV